jgi:hypothetical protein
MKYVMRRAKGVRWDRWHCMIVTRSLEMMVMNGVVRRAEVDPPEHFDVCADSETDSETSVAAMPPVDHHKQRWFTRFFRRRADVLISHARHMT